MENTVSAPESTPSPGKWIGQLVAAVILAEGIWGFLASLTSNLLVPLLARVMDTDPQSPLYLGKGELNIPGLFASLLTLCLAGIVYVLLYEWSRRKPALVRVKVMTKKASQPAAGALSIAPPPPVAAPRTAPATQISPSPAPVVPVPPTQPPKPTSPPAMPPAPPGKPGSPKEVYYNIVGEPINPTEDD
jgi:hypothetical protein